MPGEFWEEGTLVHGITSTVGWLKERTPFLRRIRLNFIYLHYAYIIACSILCSVILYGGGQLAYIDALFFSVGSATQSGLNPIDLDKLHTYQQVGLYFVTMITNPIFINTIVVFVRLTWFEKRFQHIVKDVKNLRRTRSRSFASTATADSDPGQEERNIRGRTITVVRDRLGRVAGHPIGSRRPSPASPRSSSSSSSSSSSPNTSHSKPNSSEVDRDSDSEHNKNAMALIPRPHGLDFRGLRLPALMSPDQHIAFLENQRKETGALRIPSPREFDRGGMPTTLDEVIASDAGDSSEHTKKATKRANETGKNNGTSAGDGDGDGDSDNSTSDGGSNDNGNDDQTDTGMGPGSPRSGPSDAVPASPRPGPSSGPHITIETPAIRPSRTKNTTMPRSFSRSKTADSDADDGNDGNDGNDAFGRHRFRRMSTMLRSLTQSKDEDNLPYLSWQPTIGRNSAFIDLTEEQRDELGGVEYRSLKTLAIILVSYFFFFHVLGFICMCPWIMARKHYGNIVTAAGQGRPWWALFTSASAFNDLGFTLTPDSMMSFNDAIFPLLLLGFLIVIGNTGFPCMLRFIIWVLSKVVPRDSSIWEELRFLLDHPRRCFTLLFPRGATWWLVLVLIVLNGVDLIFFVILDLNDVVVANLSGGIKFLDGLFQAISTRTAGLAVVDLSQLHPAIQVSYMVMMYISVLPIAISVRRTNVYEEKSLGIYYSGDDDEDDQNNDNKDQNYIGAHLRRQLSFDLWYIFLGLFIIAIVESGKLRRADTRFDLFAVLFEIVSAYGTVGLSLGYPTTNSSFSSQFRVLSKLVIIAMELRGRHRGLPYDLDRAILLPSESLHRQEQKDAERRWRSRMSLGSADDAMSTMRSPTFNGNYTFGRESTMGRDDAGGGVGASSSYQSSSPIRDPATNKRRSSMASNMSSPPNVVHRMPTHQEDDDDAPTSI